jgi:16S rRNA (cytidine1402-2'-O)-methyltransferase
MAGILYVVATPIGNLEDLTLRARRILGEVGFIAAEDTRRTLKLLSHYGIRKRLVSVREHNETRETARILSELRAGVDIALVSDAGTPGIADPGARLVRSAIDDGFKVVPIPGPSAVTAALSMSGMDASMFAFFGFTPRKGAERAAWLRRLEHETITAVFFEAPHRIKRTIDDVEKAVKRPIVLIKEITKINELLVKSQINGLLPTITELGEFVVVVSGEPEIDPGQSKAPDSSASELALYELLVSDHHVDPALALDLVAAKFGETVISMKKNIKKAKILVKQQTSRALP